MTLEEGLDEARTVMTNLIELGIGIDEVTARLEEEGIHKFAQPHDKLMKTIEERRRKILNAGSDSRISPPA